MLKRLCARWKLLLTLFLLTPVILWAIAQWLVSRMLQPEALVARIEASLNCRAEVTSASANLWSLPATVQLEGLKLAPRDADADQAKLLSERQPLDPKASIFAIQSAKLEMNPWALLRGQLNVRSLVVQVVNLNSDTPLSGVNTLNQMMAKPAIVAGKPNPALIPDPTSGPGTDPAQPANEPKPLNGRRLPVAAIIDSARIEHVRLDFKNEKRKELIRLEDASWNLKQFALDPGNLAKSNQAAFDFDGQFLLVAKRKTTEKNPETGKFLLEKYEQLNLGLHVDASTALFDPKSGLLGPLPFNVTIAKDSIIEDLPALLKIGKKMGKWEKYGLILPPLPNRVKIGEASTVTMNYTQPRLLIDSDFSLILEGYEIILHRGSWMDYAANTCELNLNFLGSPAISQKALSGFTKKLKDKLGDTLGGTLGDKVISLFKKEGLILPDGRLSVPMGLTGELTEPEVDDRITPILENAVLESLIPGL